MKLMLYFVLCMALADRGGAQSVGGIAQVAIVDRNSGAVLTPHFYRGEYWVAGQPGARYAIQIHNALGERMLAVTSVDGVNVISGATAGWGQTGYVFYSGQSYQITGWRKSETEVAAFTFTQSINSYAERTGRGGNVGVIGVAVFRERPPPSEVPQYARGPSAAPEAARALGMNEPASADSVAQEKATRESSAQRSDSSSVLTDLPAPAPQLGTGHGARESSYVNRTDFERRQDQPDEVIRIRYDSFDHLLAMGIVKRPQPRAPRTDPFPASPGSQYVPDPPG